MAKLFFRLGLATLVLGAWACAAGMAWAKTAPTGARQSPIPPQCLQAVVSVTQDMTSQTASLVLYERAKPGAPWRPVSRAFAATVGKNGLGFGLGLAGQDQPDPHKREGDGKAPAGVFALGPAFALPAELEALAPKLPVLRVDADLICVDSPDSRFYNQVLDRKNAVPKDYTSTEEMLAVGELYSLGLVVAHNQNPVTPGAGSCIFMHVWKAPGAPTSGCTAMAKDTMRMLLARLDPAKSPVLVQLTRADYQRLKGPWGLPPVPKRAR